MKAEHSLTFIKSLHSIIWFIMAAASIYILYAGLTKTFDIWLWLSIGLLVMESIVLLVNRWTCPLTPLAMKYTADRQDNFDIYLPLFIAKYNKIIFGTIFAVGLLLVIFNAITK
ncbi:MAG: hypothetical protein ACOZAJ_00960 [Patescibacteria group bacterium]